MSRLLPPVSAEMVRFVLTASAGLAIDITVASLLIVLAGLADIPAAAGGLFAGMVFNYFVHLGWTFRDHDRRASLGHFLQFSAGVAVTLAVRAAMLAAIAALGWQSLLVAPVRLFIAAAVSIVLSYLICRHVIFRATSPATGQDS